MESESVPCVVHMSQSGTIQGLLLMATKHSVPSGTGKRQRRLGNHRRGTEGTASRRNSNDVSIVFTNVKIKV